MKTKPFIAVPGSSPSPREARVGRRPGTTAVELGRSPTPRRVFSRSPSAGERVGEWGPFSPVFANSTAVAPGRGAALCRLSNGLLSNPYNAVVTQTLETS